MDAHVFQFGRRSVGPALSQMALDTPSRPRSCKQTGAPHGGNVGIRTAATAAPLRAARFATPREWPAKCGDFRSARSAIASSTASSSAPRRAWPGTARHRGSRPTPMLRRGRPGRARRAHRTGRRQPGRSLAPRCRRIASRALSDPVAASEAPRPDPQAAPVALVARSRRRADPAGRPCRPIARTPVGTTSTATASSPICSANWAPMRECVVRKCHHLLHARARESGQPADAVEPAAVPADAADQERYDLRRVHPEISRSHPT